MFTRGTLYGVAHHGVLSECAGRLDARPSGNQAARRPLLLYPAGSFARDITEAVTDGPRVATHASADFAASTVGNAQTSLKRAPSASISLQWREVEDAEQSMSEHPSGHPRACLTAGRTRQHLWVIQYTVRQCQPGRKL
jgi:hypothetical protein